MSKIRLRGYWAYRSEFRASKSYSIIHTDFGIFNFSYADNHNIYEILEIIKNDLKTLERAVYSGSIDISKTASDNSNIELDGSFEHINEYKLNKIVIAEAPKSYMTKEVDQNSKEGFFSGYKQLVARVSNIILEINPKYKYPHMLISTLIEGAHHQRFFAQHLPRLTDEVNGEDAIIEFSKEAAFKAIGAMRPIK